MEWEVGGGERRGDGGDGMDISWCLRLGVGEYTRVGDGDDVEISNG